MSNGKVIPHLLLDGLSIAREESVLSLGVRVDIMGTFHLPKTLRNFHGKVLRVKNVFHLTQVPFVYALVTKMVAQMSLLIA